MGKKGGQIVIAISMKLLVTEQLNGTIGTSLLDRGLGQKQSGENGRREKKILYGALNRGSGKSLFLSEQFARMND